MSQTITFYGAAINSDGQIEQQKCTKTPGQRIELKWTGKLYKSNAEAAIDLEAINCGGAR